MAARGRDETAVAAGGLVMDRAWSVADALDRLAPAADEALPGAARARVHAVAAHLPAALTRVVYLESWIGQLRPRLDLIVKIEPPDRDALVDLVRSLKAELRDEPGWADVASFAQAWTTPQSPLHDSLRAVWLELDLDPLIAPAAALRSPRVFVDFTREAQCLPSVDARLDLATEVVRVLSRGRAPRTLESLRTCLEHLPSGAHLAYLGVFAADRELPVVRACVVGLAENLAAYLGAVGWPGDVDALSRSVLGPLARDQSVQPVGVVHLDLAPDVRPRVGLEYTFPRPGRPGGVRSADALFRQLVARGWCTARNLESLRSWPRSSVVLMPHDIWHSQVTRQIGHVKITYAPGEPVVAKAYLRAAYELRAGGTLLHGRPRLFTDARDATRGGVNRPALPVERGRERPLVINGALAPSDGATPPSAVDAAPQPLDRPVVRARVVAGTAVALLGDKPRKHTRMTISTAHQEALEQILTRSAMDLDFRRALLVDPRKAILDGLGVRIPASFRVKFIERGKDVDALIVLPDLQRVDGELGDEDLDACAGGGDPLPPPDSENW